MRLMCSQNTNEVEAVRRELLKVGIASETRSHAIAEAMGVSALELWVPNERDFSEASKLYAQLQHQVGGRSTGPAINSHAKVSGRNISPANGNEAKASPPPPGANAAPTHPAESRREELKQASLLLEKGLEEMFAHESELASKCEALRSQVEDLTQK